MEIMIKEEIKLTEKLEKIAYSEHIIEDLKYNSSSTFQRGWSYGYTQCCLDIIKLLKENELILK